MVICKLGKDRCISLMEASKILDNSSPNFWLQTDLTELLTYTLSGLTPEEIAIVVEIK
jgi:hypothetical protein